MISIRYNAVPACESINKKESRIVEFFFPPLLSVFIIIQVKYVWHDTVWLNLGITAGTYRRLG